MSATQELLRFGVFELNLATEELRKSGTLIRLAPQPFKLLTLLARRSGQLVTREQIQQAIWGEQTYVDFEQGMNHCIKQIRAALSDRADNPLYIETIPRRGYRFLAPVVSKTILAPAPQVVESQSGIQTKLLPPALAATSHSVAAPPPAVVEPKVTSAPVTPTPPPAPDPVTATPAPPDVPAAAPEPAPAPLQPTPRPPIEVPLAIPALVSPPPSRGLWVIMSAIAVIVIAAIAGLLYWRMHNKKIALGAKDTIVLADFDNTTGDPVFDTALKQALSVDLEQSPFLNVLSDQRVNEQLRFMGQSADVKLSADLARQVCQRSGSKAMLLGSISGIGGHYLVRVTAVDCATGDSLGSEQAEAASREKVLSALGKAARLMRARLGESLASLQKYDTPVEQATTPSLDALKAYSLGLKVLDTQGYAASLPYFKSAIDLDPNFAMAYARLGVQYFNLNQPSLAAQYTSKAYQLRDHVSEREKLYITSHYHDLVSGNADQTIAAYQLLQQAYPREVASYMNLNSWFNSIGKYDDALTEAKAALQLDPTNVVNYHNLALTYIYLNRLDESQAILEQAKARNLADPLLADFYELAFLRADAEATARYVATGTGQAGIEDQMFALQSDTEAYYGRLKKARELTQAARDSATRSGSKEAAALWELAGALHEAELGDTKRARQQGEEALASSPGKNVQIMAGLVLARSGDSKQATSVAEQLMKQYPADTMVNDYWVPSIRAAIALNASDPGAAVDALQITSSYETGAPPPGITFYTVYLRGLAYLRQGRGPQAAAEFRKMLKYPGVVLNLSTAALAHLQLGRSLAMSGDHDGARKSYEDFLALWKDADGNLPTLKQAKAEYAKLK